MMERPKDARTLDLAEAGDDRDQDREMQRRAAFQPPETGRQDLQDNERERENEFDREREAVAENEGLTKPPGPRPETGGGRGSPHSLFEPRDVKELRSRWDSIQTRFVDEPRIAVQEADSLVEATIKQLAESFARQRADLEHQWSEGNDVSTEDLRLALRRYRSFFQRLLAA